MTRGKAPSAQLTLDQWPRWHPVSVLRLWYAISVFEQRYLSMGGEVSYDFSGGDQGSEKLEGELVACGAPIALVQAWVHATGLPERRGQDLQMRHLHPDGELCYEVVANLDANDPDSLLALPGLRATRKRSSGPYSDPSGADVQVSRDEVETLGTCVRAFQTTAQAVAERRDEVSLSAEEANALRRAAHSGGERPGYLDHQKVALLVGRGVRQGAASNGREPSRESWVEESYPRINFDFFGRNWVVARAARLLVDYCRSPKKDPTNKLKPFPVRMARCNHCSCYWAEPPIGYPSPRCPLCRKCRPAYCGLDVHGDADHPHVLSGGMKLHLHGPNGAIDLRGLAQVDYTSLGFRSPAAPCMPLHAVHRELRTPAD